MIIETNQLNKLQIHQLNELDDLCQKKDAGTPALYRHLLIEKRPTNGSLLYYKAVTNELLIGFLSVYFFYNEACEISLLVHPNHRRQKIATQLLQQILPLLSEKSMQCVIFSTSPSVTWLAERGFSYIESEYHMERVGTVPALLTTPVLAISHETIDDIAAIIEIDKRCFSTTTNPPQHFADLLKNPHYTLLVARYQGQPIGKAHIRRSDDTLSFLSDIAILPSFQGYGFGRELVAQAINEVLLQGGAKVVLDVSANRQSKAFNLYSHHGFQITQQYDYWAVSLERLRSLTKPKTLT